MTKTAFQKFYEKRKRHYNLLGVSMVDRAMEYYDECTVKTGCHKQIAKDFGISKHEAWMLIRIGLRRRENST
uniref:Uncharacterized protein n=1 Tax=viral metagenome TaxID=1070528 RepID=A0A6H2A254_9ZZZZ